MENNENNGLDPQASESGAEVDYKALYEKLQRDNANLDKYNKDLKGKLQAKLTDEERLKASQEERENYYKAIERENKSIKFKSELSKSIGNEDTVKSVAEKFLNDDIYGGIAELNKYFAGEKANYEKKIQEQSLLNNPTPPPAESKNAELTQAEFNKMSYAEKVALKQKDEKLYRKLANK